MNYRGLKFRPSVKVGGNLDVWDPHRKQWFYTALVDDKNLLNYYLTEQEGKWVRTMDFVVFDLETLRIDGSLKFKW